ncbi:YgaP-like transmembrane domain [Mycobacterium sp. Lab-001]|uniref:YgaP-like transmembrane domain n=1 Tax=Mycobacterium sp. Lab-001 TaxID=3410136 RepID=UPI003D17DC4C
MKRRPDLLQRGMRGMRRPQGGMILTGFVGVNLLLDTAMGWCPTSLLLHRTGVPAAAERPSGA